MLPNEQNGGYRDPDTFDVRGSLRSLAEASRQHKLLILMSCVLTLAVTTAYIVMFPPIFVANARVMVEKPVDNSRDSFYTTWNIFRKDDPRTEMELMTAPGLLAQVVKKEGLKYEDVYHPISSEVSNLWKKSLPGRTYHRIKDSMFPKKADPDAPTPDEIELGKTVTDMQSGIRIMPVADSNIGELTVKGPSRRVARMANTLLDLYLAQRAERQRSEAQRNVDALDKEVDVASKEAQRIATKRLDFLRANHLSFDLAKESQQLTKLVELEDGIAANHAKQASLEGSLQLVESQLAAEPVTRLSATTEEVNPVREAARLKRLDLETGLISLRSVYREDSPEVQEALRNMAKLDAVIANEPAKVEKVATSTLNSTRQDLILSRNSLRSQLEGIKSGVAVMEETDRTLRTRISAVPGIQDQLRDLDRQYALVSDRYQALSAKRAQAAVSLAMADAAMPSMQVVQPASNPDDAAWPKPKYLYPSALIVGLILGVFAAQIRSVTSGRVRRGDLERELTGSPIYGTIRIPIGTRPFSVSGRRRAGASLGD
jgi:uncharacterized protein involved in exopolysaccharide biosynthesis